MATLQPYCLATNLPCRPHSGYKYEVKKFIIIDHGHLTTCTKITPERS